VDVVGQGVEKETCLLLDVGIGSQNQEHIEPQLLEEYGR
jgi:hypothetical protein